jgi:hypothetical protein
MLKRLILVGTDFLRYNAASRIALSYAIGARDTLAPLSGSNATATALLRRTFAARLRGRAHRSARLERRIIHAYQQWSPDGFDWDRFFPDSKPRLVQKSIILKPPKANGEKGVLFVSFESNWLRLLRYADVKKLAADYNLVLSPTWSPPYDLAFLVAYRLWPGTLVTILSNLDDEIIFHELTPNVVTVPLLASSWVDPDTFCPLSNGEKRHDIVMLATFAHYKRHFALFRAISEMRKKPRVLILGHRQDGRTRTSLEEEATLFGVGKQVTILEALPDREMIRALQSAKVCAIMSMGEGSCVAVAESLFANVPVGLVAGANIGSRAFINAYTGRFLRSDCLAEDLESFIREFSAYNPRRWMIENKASYVDSCRILNESLKSLARKQGRPWTTDIASMHWRPNPVFACQADRDSLRQEYLLFERRYGIGIELRV